MRIFVSNLAFQVTADDLKSFFIAYDKVESVFIVTDRATGKSKGFAYVDITPDSEAKAAIEELNGRLLQDRPVILKVALPPGEVEKGQYRAPRKPGPGGPRPKAHKAGAPGRPANPGKGGSRTPGAKPGAGAKKPGNRRGPGAEKPPSAKGGRGGKNRI